MNSVTIFFLLFVTFTFANIFNIGGTTCIPDEATECTAREGSSMVTLTGGASVDSDGVITAGAADTMGIAVAFTIAEDGFASLSFRGLGLDTDSAVLIWAGEADLTDATTAWKATSSFWTGFIEAGDYTAVVTSNGGAAEACGEFTATLTPIYYDVTGVTDTWVAPCNTFLPGFWAAMVTFTPEADGFYNAYGVGRMAGEDTGAVSGEYNFVMETPNVPTNLSSSAENCNATVVEFDATGLGYPLVAGTEYTFFIKDADTDGEITVYVNFAMAGVETVYADCDNLDYDDQADWLRPNIPAVSVTDECVENTAEYFFDVRHSMYDTEVFVVVDTVGCGNPDDDRSDVDGAIVLYYGHQGAERGDDGTPAVGPDACENFIIAGDSGDGGAVFYWFPANAGLTLVPTTYSSGASGVYWLTEGTYDIVGCVPANPYLPVEPTGGDSDNAIVAVVSSVFFLLAFF